MGFLPGNQLAPQSTPSFLSLMSSNIRPRLTMLTLKRKWFLNNFVCRLPGRINVGLLMVCLIATLFAHPQQVSGQDAQQRYDELLAEWQEVYVELTKVYGKFQYCEEWEAEALQAEFLELKAKGDRLSDETVLAAADCVEEATTPNPEMIELLIPLPEKYYGDSKYEVSARIGRALRKHNRDDFALMFNTLRSSFFSNDFEHSGKLFDEILARPEWLDENGEMPEALLPLYTTQKDLAVLWEKEQKLREAEALTDHLPRIKFETTQGDIVVELYEDQFPQFVNNLMCLIEEKEQPFYNDLAFSFSLLHQFAVTGSQSDDGTQTYPLGEISLDTIRESRGNFRGSFSFDIRPTRIGQVVTTGCQFVQIPIPELNGNTLVLGRIIEGLEVVGKLEKTHELDENNEVQPIEAVIPDPVSYTHLTLPTKRIV